MENSIPPRSPNTHTAAAFPPVDVCCLIFELVDIFFLVASILYLPSCFCWAGVPPAALMFDSVRVVVLLSQSQSQPSATSPTITTTAPRRFTSTLPPAASSTASSDAFVRSPPMDIGWLAGWLVAYFAGDFFLVNTRELLVGFRSDPPFSFFFFCC